MRAGALRNVIDIESKSAAGRDALNAPIVGWAKVHEGIFCEKTARRGAEKYDVVTNQRYSETVFRFRCRYSEVVGVTASMRILHEGQVYNIVNVLPEDQRRDDVVLEATLQDGHV